MEGWVKLYRQTLENPIVCKDAEYFSIWCYLLLNATHKEHKAEFNGKVITLMPGQLITGRKKIAQQFNISESKVQRVLKKLEIEQQIEQQTSTKKRLVSVLNWEKYQSGEQQDEQQVNNKRTTTEQQVNTNKNVRSKECNNEIIKTIVEYLNEKSKRSFKPSSKGTQRHINARLAEGFVIDDFKKVIDIKCEQWLDNVKMNSFLRPETLFGNKFESYRQEWKEPEKPKDYTYQGDLSHVDIDDVPF